MVARSENQFFAFCEKTIREKPKILLHTGDSELNSAYLQKKRSKIGSSVPEILLIKVGKSHKNDIFRQFFLFFKLFSYFKTPKDV